MVRRRREPVAQPVEHLTFNQGVAGSNPAGLTTLGRNNAIDGRPIVSETRAPTRPASKTAIAAAVQRALHHAWGAEPKIVDDPIAVRLLGPDFPEDAKPIAADGHVSVLLRSRFAEDRLAGAVRRGITQCVILGAGLDSFAYRQPAWAQGLRLFEIDHHASLEEKK